MGLIYLDTCLLIYVVENDPAFAGRTLAAMRGAATEVLAISSLVRMECLIKPLKTGDLALQRRYESAFDQFVQLAMPDAVFMQAAQLRAHFGLKTPDALHLASAAYHRCTALWTNDERLAQAGHGLALNVLK